jgi:hypothetical protein
MGQSQLRGLESPTNTSNGLHAGRNISCADRVYHYINLVNHGEVLYVSLAPVFYSVKG